MNILPLLALGALIFASKKKSEATVRVVSKMPDLKPLPVFNEAQVFADAPVVTPAAHAQEDAFKSADDEAAKESQVPSLEAWGGTAPLPSKPQFVVQPPLELDAEQNDAVSPAPVPVTPGQASEAAASNPGMPVDEVVQADPVAAARELASYVANNRGRGAKLGTKSAPSDAVRALQQQMGVEPADGIYGPQTRARGQSLGVSMPARS